METQEKIISTFEELQHAIYLLKIQVAQLDQLMNQACERHIASDFQKEWLLDRISSRHDLITLRYESLQLIWEAVAAFRDFDGFFLDHEQLLQSLEALMLNYAEEEEYEIASIIKKWYEKFAYAVFFTADMTC
jgi:hypothetical protein